MRRDMVAGMCSGSICGKRMWVVITAGAPALDARNKRFQFPLHQLVKAAVDAGQAKVGIHRRIAMAGEMLERAVDAAVQQAAHHLAAVFGHTLRRIAVAAHADDRVVRVAVDVHDRGQIEIHARSLRSSWAVSRPIS